MTRVTASRRRTQPRSPGLSLCLTERSAGWTSTLGRRGQLDQVAVRVADVGHVLAPGLRLRRTDRLRALLDGTIERGLHIVRHEAHLESRSRARALLRPNYARQVRSGQLLGGEGQGGVTRVQLRVLPALMQETAPLAQRPLVEVQAGCDV